MNFNFVMNEPLERRKHFSNTNFWIYSPSNVPLVQCTRCVILLKMCTAQSYYVILSWIQCRALLMHVHFTPKRHLATAPNRFDVHSTVCTLQQLYFMFLYSIIVKSRGSERIVAMQIIHFVGIKSGVVEKANRYSAQMRIKRNNRWMGWKWHSRIRFD